MKKIIALALCFIVCLSVLTGCSKYEFQYAFLPIEIGTFEAEDQDLSSSEIDEAYVEKIKTLLTSLTSFINEKFDLNISKPVPEVRSYSPDWGAAASYLEGTIYINTELFEKEKIEVDSSIIHELIHYLSDNNGIVGFNHETVIQGNSIELGRGLTEGFTDMITVMYCNEYNLPLDESVKNNLDMYADHRSIAKAYYMLESQTVEWFFTNNHESLTEFTKNNIEKVANIPSNYSKEFAVHLYIYPDELLRIYAAEIFDEVGFRLMYTATFEIVAITVRSSSDIELKKQIYEDAFSRHDQNDVLKNMIFG